MSDKRSVRCAIYTRKSTEEGLEQGFNSLDAQRQACEAYVISQKADGWISLSDRYDDGGYSGGTLKRPALQQLLKNIEAGIIDIVVVYKIDRLSRSLMDFAKLVEVLDRKSVTFLSVTQSFNTTTSMGRLTLNVLLSFAQFEREIAGERIRDKFAASKMKGIWMGGNPPLGYDIGNRRLEVNLAEAETVRRIFQRYLDLGCVRLLRDDLMARGINSKLWISRAGVRRGGKPLGLSSLYLILNNPVYLGQTVHKGLSHQGQHEPIVSQELFGAVQRRLAELCPPRYGKNVLPQDALFRGILFDETDTPMLPTYTIKPGGVRYRYYASKPTLKGGRSQATIHRVPAAALEALISNVISRLRLPSPRSIGNRDPSILHRIKIRPNSIAIQIDRATALSSWRAETPEIAGRRNTELINHYRGHLADGEELSDNGEHLLLILPVRALFRGGQVATLNLNSCRQHPLHPDINLIKAVARAHHWKQLLQNSEVTSIEALAARVKQDRGHVGKTLKLAFLSPELIRAIVRGEQPAGIHLTNLMASDIPVSWQEQADAIRRLTTAHTWM